ncbi:hypothetical protein PYW08_015179 [Mythimna loreyi]|uniref:Uncharacterized protein n=1 Tax=Mythimna loreyi TaxID=667449 RepID=A0ACC2QW16_9NEOP|nr:hypothetical protein PYW08_015179 [Mythimna loreyi]
MLSGVAVLSPTESGGCSSSDITEPRSPRSPESSTSSCSTSEESASARMPPWAYDPAPPAPRRIAAQPAPVRRSQPPHRRITEYFNHKMKPQNGLKRDNAANDDTKKKCLPKNGVTHDLEKYISYLSQTLSPKVLMDVGKQNEVASRKSNTTINGAMDAAKTADLSKTTPNGNFNGLIDYSRPKEMKDKNHTNMNGFLEIRHASETSTKGKQTAGLLKELIDGKRPGLEIKTSSDPSANGVLANKHTPDVNRRKVPIPVANDLIGMRVASSTPVNQSPKKAAKPDKSRMNGVVSSTTKLDSRMNGVTYGSNNLNLNPITKPAKKETQKKAAPAKRTNRKSSACIANSKNLTWSKANNLKQVQLQKQNCTNISSSSPIKTMPGEASPAAKMHIPNGVRQAPIINGNYTNLNVPVPNNFQNCHQLNIPQPCNGTINPNNLTSFVAVPQNMMLTTLRIPQNGLAPQTLGQQNNMAAYNRPNVNVSSPTKLNGQFVFPLMQNLNGTVVQIPNLMTKMPNFVLPSTPQLATQRQDHLQNQQAASILINGTLLKLANTMTSAYTNVNKSEPVTSQPIPGMNKNVTGIQAVGVTVQSKQNYAVNFSHPVLMPQPGYIVTSVQPNMNVKETWSYTNTNTVSSSQTTYSSHLVHHQQPIVPNYHSLHASSIPIAPVKPPDNPIQGTDPPSSTVKEPELFELKPPKCEIPWLSKTVNNNIFPLQPNKKNSRPFAEISSISEELEEFAAKKAKFDLIDEKIEDSRTDSSMDSTMDSTMDSSMELRKIEEVARREETIFTQITVLKDVSSSDVHNTVIETNFCSTTTESESGIGTDKSIGSPSDSQTSKDCDEDSSLSLSISVCSVEVQSQKSPILKQPKTLRFPPRSLTKPSSDKRKSSTDTTSTVSVCLWENCKREFDGDPGLLEHIQNAHVETQAGKENYVCLWEQCKVRGKPSCSRLWLERHTLTHSGNKPFKCLVDGCERRFSTPTLLERHVNNHFNEASPSNGSGKKSAEGSVKLIRRNGKKLRYRRQPWSARMFDFFDAGMMEGLVWRLARCTRWRLSSAALLREPPGRHTLTLRAALTATRYNAAEHRREALVTYYPPNVLEDEWVPEKEVTRIKRVEIAGLSAHVKVALYEHFCASYSGPAPPPPPPPPPARPRRLAPRLLAGLLAPRRRAEPARVEPLVLLEPDKPPRPSGAKKRKMGRRYGGAAFWPCGR